MYLRERLASIVKLCRLSESLQWLTCTLAPTKDSAFAGASPTCREYEGDLLHEDVGHPVPLLSRVLTVNELCFHLDRAGKARHLPSCSTPVWAETPRRA